MSPRKSYAARMEVNEDINGYVFSCFFSSNFSFAVWLIDADTQKDPLGEVRVTLNGENTVAVEAMKNLSGYYIFSSLPEGKYTLSVESEFYFTEEKPVNIPFVPSNEPVYINKSSVYINKEPVIPVFLKLKE